jgi:uncharacterized protein
METNGRDEGGRPLDDEIVEELAEEAEAGYDAEEVLRRRGAGPGAGSSVSPLPRVPESSREGKQVTDRVATPDDDAGRPGHGLGLTPITDDLVAEAVRLLGEAAPPGSEVIMFGSAARGEAGPHSDLDFLVIEPRVADRGEEMFRLRETLDGLRVAADIVVVDRQEAERDREVHGTVVHAALGHGRAPAIFHG